MRDILFRGKRLDNGAWVYGSLLQVECEDGSIVTAIFDRKDSGGDAEVHPSTVGQYTGLMDKIGTRVFEGDVLKDDWGKVYEVFFNARNCSFMVKLEHATNEWEIGNYRLGEDWSDTIRVIGNIHDNTELLEGGASE